MIRETLTFRIDLIENPKSRPADRAAQLERFKQQHQFRERLAGELGLPLMHGWMELDLSLPKLAHLVETMEHARDGELAKLSSGMLTQSLDPLDPNCEWFLLTPKNDQGGWGVKTYPEIRADWMPKGSHVAGGHAPFVSERFRDVVTDHRLSGVEFLWIKDTSRFRAMQWYLPIAVNPLGRGVDHPWFDATTLRGAGSWQSTSPPWRSGVWHFRNDQFRAGAGYSDPLKDRLLSLFAPQDVHVNSFRRVLRQHLPDTDFAFLWRGEDCDPQYNLGRVRLLCFNRKSRDVLVAHELLGPDDYTGIQVLDQLPGGAEDLDQLGEGPPPFYPLEQLAEFRTIESRERAEFEGVAKPDRSKNLEQGIRRLEAYIVSDESARYHLEPLDPVELQNAMSELQIPVPYAWRRVLDVANGGYFGDIYVTPVDKLVESHRFIQEICDSEPSAFPTGLLRVASNSAGDWLSLHVSRATAEDVQVIFYDHETLRPIMQWDSVAEFLDDMLPPDKA